MSAGDIARYFANTDGRAIGHAFSARRAVTPWRDRQPIPDPDIAATWSRLMADGAPSRARLAYVHVPFCANHCLFCGFYRNAYTAADAAAYAERLVAEIEREAAEPGVRAHPIEALYFGGGTPSALSASDLARILQTVQRRLPLAPDCEITLEGRIIHFDDDKIDACIAAGVNRISVGVQSFDTEVRRRQGRRAGKEDALRFLAGIRDRDKVALVIDLLYGLPGQTPDVWQEDLRIADGLAPDGVDLYGLNVIRGTPLATATESGKLRPATLVELGAMYETGSDFLGARGWRQLSNSHWARTPRERNRYNLRIKQGMECLAYGSGAGGIIDGYSYSVAGDLQHYSEAVDAGRKPLDAISVSDSLQPARSHVTAGFEVGRLDLGAAAITSLPHASHVRAQFASLLAQWQSCGLVLPDGDVVNLTVAGRFWYSNLAAAFNDIITAVAPAARAARDTAASPSNPRQKAGQTA